MVRFENRYMMMDTASDQLADALDNMHCPPLLITSREVYCPIIIITHIATCKPNNHNMMQFNHNAAMSSAE